MIEFIAGVFLLGQQRSSLPETPHQRRSTSINAHAQTINELSSRVLLPTHECCYRQTCYSGAMSTVRILVIIQVSGDDGA